MYKKLLFGDEARQALMIGIDIVAKAVITTLGPKGRNVAMARQYQVPNVVHDGVSVAKEINLRDPFQQIGVMLIKEAASKNNSLAGDGTTTATLIAQKITHEGIKAINSGSNPMMTRFGIEKAVKMVLAELKKMSIDIKSKEETKQVATISSGFAEIGEKISEAINKVGKDGIVTVERGQGAEITVDYKEGMSLDRGYASPYFSTNERLEAEVAEPYILITDEKLSAVHDVEKFFEMFMKEAGQKELIIIADEIEADVLSIMIVNNLKTKLLKSLGIKSPGFGERRKEMLEDIAALVGATVISKDAGRSMQDVHMSDLGKADKVWAGKDETHIIGGRGKDEIIQKRVSIIKNELSKVTNDFDREKLEERLAKISSGVAQINVGASTETELKEKLERVKDAVGATKAAMEEGIVPGGGVALLRAREVLKDVSGDNNDEKIGIRMVYDALVFPIYKLMENAGKNGEHIALEILANKDKTWGYDLVKEEFGSMIKMGIIDPVKVTKGALLHGASVAMMILTTEVLIAPDVVKEVSDGEI